MRRFALAGMLLLAACSDKSMSGASAVKSEQAPAAAVKGEVAAVAPSIDYAYRLGFRLPADRIAAAQAAHLRLCDAMGAIRCRLVAQELQGGDGAGGRMAFEVESSAARSFADRMEATVGEADGETSARSVSAEDLSKSIIDSEARIRAKQALADRLYDVIRTRSGKISEVVEAERAFADVQEELDATRSGLETMRRRVSTSRIDAEYSGIGAGGGGGWAIRDAVDEAGTMMGMSVAALVRAFAIVLPWLVVAGGALWAVRVWRRRREG